MSQDYCTSTSSPIDQALPLSCSFQILLGGPKLRRWYGAPDLLPKDGDGGAEDEEDEPQGT